MDLLGSKALTTGQRIRQARKYRGMTSTKVATRLGVSQAIMSRWETSTRVCRLHQLVKIAAILRVPLAYLTDENILPAKLGRQYRGTWAGGRW